MTELKYSDPTTYKREYDVYKNDLKYKSFRNIDPSRAIWTEDIKEQFETCDHDTIKYRLSECKKNNFTYLDLSGLDLNEIPDFSKHKYCAEIHKIKFLFLNDNKLKKIGKEILSYTNLEVLDLSSNCIEKIKYLPTSLIELACHNNQLTDLPVHDNLTRMDCSYNQLVKLEIYPKIVDILCNDNKLTELQSYPCVSRIVCKNNPITHINSQKSLVKLDCSDTLLCDKLENMNNLKYLICNNTKITGVENVKELVSLELIDCNFMNKIPYLPKLEDLLLKKSQNTMLDEKFKIDKFIEEKGHIFIRFVIQ